MNAFGTLQAETGRAVTFSHRRNCDPKPDDVRQHNDPELFRWIAEIQLRAKRRIGELSSALEKVQGEHLPNVPRSGRMEKRAALAAAGLSKSEAHRCEQLATVDESVSTRRFRWWREIGAAAPIRRWQGGCYPQRLRQAIAGYVREGGT